MTLSGDALGQARYDALDLTGLSQDEKDFVLQKQKEKGNVDINYFVSNSVILPTGTPPMSNSGGPVTGTGLLS